MKTLALAEISVLAFLAGLASTCPAPDLAHLAVATGFVGLALIPWPRGRWARPGSLRPERLFCLLAFFVILARLRLEPAAGLRGMWPLIPAATLFLVGAALSLRSELGRRIEILSAVVVALLAVGLSAGAAEAILLWRSTAGMTPGALSFLGPLSVWAASWFGLDAWLRLRPMPEARGAWSFLVDRRPALSMTVLLLFWWIGVFVPLG